MEHEEGKKITFYWSWQKTASVICAALIIPTVIIFSFSLSLKETLLNPKYYKANLVKVDAYNRLIQDGIPALILQTKVSDNSLANTFAQEAAVFVIQKTIDPSWVQGKVEGLIDAITAHFSQIRQGIPFDLSGAQTYLTKISDSLAIVDQMIPACSQTKSAADCANMKVNLDQAKAGLAQAKDKIDSTNLAAVDLGQNIDNANAFIATIDGFAKNVNSYLWVSLAVIMVLILAIVLLNLDHLTFFIKTTSLAMMIGAFLTLLLVLIVRPFIPTEYIGATGSSLPPEMQSIIGDFLKASILGIFKYLAIFSAIVLAAFIIGYFKPEILKKIGFKYFAKQEKT